MSWAVCLSKKNVPGSSWPARPRCGIWRLGTGGPWRGEGTSDLLLRACLLGRLSLVCFFLYSQEYPGRELMGGGIGWIAHFLNTFQHPDRLVEIIPSTADEKYDHATFVLEFGLEASRSPFPCCGGGVLQLCLPLYAQPRGRATFSLLLLSRPFFSLS